MPGCIFDAFPRNLAEETKSTAQILHFCVFPCEAHCDKINRVNDYFIMGGNRPVFGESGCGKTELARYIAYKANLPFVYVRFSALVSSYLGSTQANIARIFDYVRSEPCVLCFDEIDAVGMARGQRNDVGEMNRIVIALMQELDKLPNNVIIVGTTNRFDRLDPALIRRFPIQYEV